MNQDLSKLSQNEVMTILRDRVSSLLNMTPENSNSYADRIFKHYKQLNIFPKSAGTLDASIKALTAMWNRTSQAAMR